MALFKIQHGIEDVLGLSHSSHRLQPGKCVSGECIGVLMTSARVTALRPPLVITASAARIGSGVIHEGLRNEDTGVAQGVREMMGPIAAGDGCDQNCSFFFATQRA